MNQINRELTPGQVEVLDLIRLGYSNKVIASKLDLSIDTIKSRISRIFLQLRAKNRTDAVVKGHKAGYINIRED